MAERRKAIRTAAGLVAEIERRIAQGILAPGERLEPVRTLAAQLGLAPNTVATAYRTLGHRGHVIGEGRRGTFVAPRATLTPAIDRPALDGLIDLSAGNPDVALLPGLDAAFGSIAVEHVLYGADPIDPSLGPLLRADLERDGIEGEHLAVVGGALDGIERTLASSLRPGDRVGVEDPGYPAVTGLVTTMGLRLTPMAIDSFGPTPDSLAAALADGVSAVVVTPRAQNPTGAAFDEVRAAELRQVTARHPGVLVIEDDHAGVVAGQPCHRIVDQGSGRWVTVRSMAKSLGPDLRLAALAGDRETVGRVAARQSLGAGWVSMILQRLVAALLGDSSLGPLLDSAAETYAVRRQVVVDALEGAGHAAHGRSGLNVWVPVDDEGSVVAAMQHRGFAIRSGSRFRIDSPPGVRISTAGAQPETLNEAITALVEILAGTQPARTA